MPTYDEVLTLGLYYGLIPFFIFLGMYVFFALRRHKWRRGVYADIQLRSGPDTRKQYIPKKGMILTKKLGMYVAATEGTGGNTFKGKPLYRYLEGYPYPIVYTHDRIPVEITETVKVMKDGKEIEQEKSHTEYQEIVKTLPLAPSAYRLSAYEKDRTHSQVYGGSARLEFMLIILAAISIIILVAVLAK